MFFDKAKPEFTIRMLLDEVTDSSQFTRLPNLKAFSHFTLGCNAEDQTEKVKDAFDKLLFVASSQDIPFVFKGVKVKNLTNDDQNPLWAIELEIPQSLRNILATLFDSIMCPETDGNLYLWGNNSKCPHITLGKTQEDRAKGMALVGNLFKFNRLDYKRLGPHDPQFSFDLNGVANRPGLGTNS